MKIVTSDAKTKLLEEQHSKVQKDVEKLPLETRNFIRAAQAEVSQEIEKISKDVFDFESEDRIRKAGYTPQQAEDIAFLSKSAGVGKMFSYAGKTLVLTPFKTVVDAQIYITAIQDRLLETTTVPVEIEVAQLKKAIQEFTSLSFVGLIGLAFKRSFNNLRKGKNNG